MEDRSGFFFRVGRDDTLLQEIMDYFQEQGRGKLSRAIRDGLRLFWDLSHQRTDVLIELFPFVTDAICPKTPDNDEMEKRIADMVASRLEGRLQSTSSNHDIPDTRSYGIPAMKPSKLQKVVAMPTFDDDEPSEQDTIVLTAAVYQNTGENFIGSLTSLGQ